MSKSYLLISPKKNLTETVSNHISTESIVGGAILSKTLYYFTFKSISIYPKAKIKLLHIAGLYADLKHPNVESLSNLTLLNTIFGTPPFSVNVFDKWWELVEIDSGAYALDAANSSVREDINLSKVIQNTGVTAFDLWLQDGMDRYISLEDETKLDAIFDNQDDK